jgi:phosphoribosylamine--glycine ligase
VRVLVLGSGGREHALCLALSRDPAVRSIVCAPGNAGTTVVAEPRPLDLASLDAILALTEDVRPDLTIVGPEGPLVLGAADVLRDRGFSVFGPSAAAAVIEGSKAFAKDVMVTAGVPTAASEHHLDLAAALGALDRFGDGVPWVIKHDGLAAGKGVVVTTSRAEAARHIEEMGPDGVVLEDYLDGPEVSLFAIVDAAGGIHPLIPAQDHKRVGDGDTGPNTGGMGAYTPLAWAPDGLVDQVRREVLEPTVAQLAARGTPFQGLLYAGLALTSKGLRVVEFNARFGDPETQSVLAMLDAPLTGVLSGAVEPTWRAGASVTVVLAAEGYPAAPKLGGVIGGLDSVRGADVLHAGTRLVDGQVVASGGRVLAVTAVGGSLEEARGVAYDGLAGITLDGSHFRSDIGLAALEGRIRVPQ